MVQSEAEVRCIEYCRGRVHGSQFGQLQGLVASQVAGESIGQELRPTVIYCDNQSCIQLSENLVFHDRSKHIEIKYSFIRYYVQRGAVMLQYISTDEQVADILTKSLGRGTFVFFRDKLGVVQNTFLSKREC